MRLFILAFFVAALSGCGPAASDLPALQPVTGSVTQEKKPLKDCQVRFTPSTGGERLVITAVSEADGKFTASTFTSATNVRQPGAPEGTYKVTFTLPMNADQSGGGKVDWPDTVVVKKGENRFDFEVPKKGM